MFALLVPLTLSLQLGLVAAANRFSSYTASVPDDRYDVVVPNVALEVTCALICHARSEGCNSFRHDEPTGACRLAALKEGEVFPASASSSSIAFVSPSSLLPPCPYHFLALHGADPAHSYSSSGSCDASADAAVPPLDSPRETFALGFFGGVLAACGGSSASDDSLFDTCSYLDLDASPRQWVQIADRLLVPLYRMAFATMHGKMFMIGGTSTTVAVTRDTRVQYFDFASRTLATLTEAATGAQVEADVNNLQQPCAVALPAANRIVVTGGRGTDIRSKVLLLDVAAGTWSELPPMIYARRRHACGLVELGGEEVVMVWGGQGLDQDGVEVSRAGEVEYLPASALSSSWTSLPAAAVTPDCLSSNAAAKQLFNLSPDPGSPVAFFCEQPAAMDKSDLAWAAVAGGVEHPVPDQSAVVKVDSEYFAACPNYV